MKKASKYFTLRPDEELEEMVKWLVDHLARQFGSKATRSMAISYAIRTAATQLGWKKGK